MHVAIIGSRGYPYVYSGYETFVAELAPRLVVRGHRVTVYCHRELFAAFPPSVNGVELAYTRGFSKKTLSQLSHTLTACLHAATSRRDRADVVLIVNAANGPFVPMLRALGFPCAINVDGLEWLRPKWKGLGARYFRTAASIAARTSDVVVTDAQAMADVYRREFNADSTVIAYGANPAHSTDAGLIAPFGLTKDSYYLIVGRLVPDNNADLLVRGFTQSKTARKLVVVGDVPYSDEYARNVRTLGDSRVEFVGYVKDPNVLRELYCNCFAYFHGHEYGGTNPTLLKALAYGCCVLALDTPFSREVLAGPKYGRYFAKSVESVAGAIASLESDPGVALAYRAKARDRISEAYTWDSIVSAYETTLKAILRNGS